MLKCCEFRSDVIVDKFREWIVSTDFDDCGECGWAREFAIDTANTNALLFNECDVDSEVDDTVGKPKVSTDVADNAADLKVINQFELILKIKSNIYSKITACFCQEFSFCSM